MANEIHDSDQPSSTTLLYAWIVGIVWLLLLTAFAYHIYSPHKSSSFASASDLIALAGVDDSQARLALISPIDVQLRYLREKNIQSAYEETTKAFKVATSLDGFEKFVENYPILIKHQDIEIKSSNEQGNRAEVTVVLNPQQENVTVQYQLAKEEGQWKIWSLSIVTPYTTTVSSLLSNPSSMLKPIEGQLQALREGDFVKAYYNYTTKEFQSSSSLEAFQKFMDTFANLKKYEAVEFKAPSLEQGTGRVEIDFHNKGYVLSVEYTLGIEDDQWKIWHMRVLKQETSAEGEKKEELPQGFPSGEEKGNPVFHPMQFVKYELGTQVDAEGAITAPLIPNEIPKGDIYINIYIKQGTIGDRIELHLKHVESQSSLPSISTSLQQEGNSVVSFAFSPPAVGWPKGHYQLEAISNSGVSRNFSFTLE
jgi:hypothetical protein